MMLRGLYSVIFIVLIVLMAILIVFSMDTRDTSMEVNGVPLSTVSDLASSSHDAVIHVIYPQTASVSPVPALEEVIAAATELDKTIETSPSVVFSARVSGGRLVVTCAGPFTPYHDVRLVYEAARAGMKKAIDAGARRPILIVQSNPDFDEADLVLLLGAFEELYVPIEIREWFPEKGVKLESLGIYGEGLSRPLDALIRNAVALERARVVTRDIGAGDPERMTAQLVATYVRQEFANSQVSVQVIDDVDTIRREYPLFAAVNRAAHVVERHRGNVIFLEYNPPTGAAEETVILVGKGITYDTGGVDLKVNGAMIGMSRDKAGAAAVAGFLKACDILRPRIKVIGVMCMARNSIGEESYVSDELIVSRSGKTVRIGDTDAEGRMVMADLLYEMKERAATEVRPHIYTIATLTGHARLAAGTGYTIVMDNHVARAIKHAIAFQESGESVGDMMEVSRIRREDFVPHRGRGEGDDLFQSLNQPSAVTPRGHQGPAAFLMLVSDLHEGAVPYSHLDIAASGGSIPERATGAPVLALAKHYKLIQF